MALSIMICTILKKLISIKKNVWKRKQFDNNFLYTWLNKKKNLSGASENEVLCDNNTIQSQLPINTDEATSAMTSNTSHCKKQV